MDATEEAEVATASSKKFLDYPIAPDSGKGSFPLAPGEYLTLCPYDSSHRPLNTRIGRHLEKCRRNYVTAAVKQGEQPPSKLLCQYVSDHQVYPPELLMHERICREKFQKLLSSEEGVYEFLRMRGIHPGSDLPQGFDLDNLSSLLNYVPLKTEPRTYELGRVFWADPSLFDESKLSCVSPEWRMKNEPGYYPPNLKRKLSNKKAELKKRNVFSGKDVDEVELEEYWRSDEDVPPFDWMEHIFNMDKPIFCYPPGLTKLQRNQWLVLNGQRMQTEFGIVPVEEDNGNN